ncbi:MAG: hypothetical protein QW598_09855 [Pyrobaculum sp.]
MHNKTKLLLATALMTLLAATAFAQYGPGQALPSAFNVVMQINDARAGYQLGLPMCYPWNKSLVNYPPYSFAAGKNFTLIIREIASSPQYPPVFQDYRVSAVANSTGFVTFNINVPAGVDVTKKSSWYVAIVVQWPRPGYYFLIYNQTFTNAMFIDVIGNLSGRPELTGTKTYTGPWGVINVTNGAGRFGNLSSSVIHTFYVGVNTLGKPFTLTFTRTVTIAGTTITLDDNVGPATGPSNYVKAIDPNVQYVFGPFTYLGTYVTSLGSAGTSWDTYKVAIDPSRVTYNHYVYITIEGSRGVAIQSKNNIQYAFGLLRQVAITLNKAAGPGTGVTAPMSCGLVIWNMTMYTVTITGLLDLKGNPIFNPENFRYKIQLKVGNTWVTLDRAQPTWRATLGDVKAVLNQVCGTITSFADIMNCYRTLGPDGFRQAVLKLYDPVTLARLGGQLQLTDDSAKVSTTDITTKLVVEYSYTDGQDTVKAIVLEVPLAEPVNFQGVLNVSVLPIQIRLWRWSNLSLPPAVPNPREYFYTDPLDLASLRFVVTGDTIYLDRMAYDGAITYDPWLGQVIWSLPPYQPVPGLVGNVKATLLALFNASGYLPMPTLIGNLTTGGVIEYFNYTDAAANANFFAPFQVGLVGSYAYKFRIYSGDALVGTANLVAYYPTVDKYGHLIHAMADEVLVAQYYDNKRTDMYALQIVQPGRFYDREHVLHIAIARIFQNILMRDACGNPVMGVSAGLAGASLSLVINVGSKNITIARLPVGSEVPIDILVPIDEWGNPQLDLAGGYVRAYAVLNYFGYTLYPVSNVSQIPASSPQWFMIPVKFGVVAKPVIYLPIAPLLFRVWSQAVSVDYDPLKEPLMGFVVRVFSTATGDEMARSISNKDGYAYVPNIPVGVPIRVQVRTIVPSSDKAYSYTYDQIQRKNDYASYAKALGFTPADNVYTLGTRGYTDSGLVVYTATMSLTAQNATKYICAKNAIDLPVEVYDVVVRVFDKTGQYLLRSQPVFLGPYPQATRPVLLNVTLLLADEDSPYKYASIWRDPNIGDFKILTDFRAIGITGMRSIYLNLASKYLSEAQKALGCPQYTTANFSRAINAYALAAMAGYVANASTDRYAAVYLLTSNQPKDIIDICKMKPAQAGAAEIARLFMKGQRLRFVVWYMGQKVFDDYVTITGPLVDIKADVFPVNVTTYTKSMRLPVDTFVGFTITDVYVGLALNETDGMFANKSLVPQLISPFTDMYKTYNLYYLLTNELAKSTGYAYNDNVTAFYSNGTKAKTDLYGVYQPAQFGGDFVYLPNIAVLRNVTTAKYLWTVLNAPKTVAQTIRQTQIINAGSGNITVPASQTLLITVRGAKIVIDPGSNATYLKLTSYNGTENSNVVQPQLIISGALVIINGQLVKNYIATINANYTIDLTALAKCGSISIVPGAGDITVDITINAGKCPAVVSFKALNATYRTTTLTSTAANSTEYAVSFDRWFLVPYDWSLAAYNVLYHATDVVERNDVLNVLSYTGKTRICASLAQQVSKAEDDEYVYTLTLAGVQVPNYRTLQVKLPWKIGGGGKALVNITAYFANNNTKIDSIVYNLTATLAGARGRYVTVNLPLNFGKVGAKAYDIATTGASVKFEIRFMMYDPTSGPTSVCAVKLVPLMANYSTVSMYECTVPTVPGVAERIDPATVVYYIDRDMSNTNGFGETYDAYGGFGTPITYVVKSGEVALLPSWYYKTAVAGSRIARIWLIAASDDPSKGPALGTKYYSYTVKDDKVTINVYKFEKYLVVNFVPGVCPAGWASVTYLDEFDGTGRITGLGFGTGGTSALVLSNYTKVPMWNATAMWLAGGVFKLPTVALDRLTVENNAQFPIVVDSLNVKYGDYQYNIPMAAVRVDAGKTQTALLNGYGFGRTYMFNVTDVWAFRLVQPNYQYGLNVYHAGLLDAIKYFGLSADKPISAYLKPLTSAYYTQNVLYASHAEVQSWTFNILGGKITEWTRGMWGDLVTNSSDFDYKYVFSFPTLPLREIRDWNDRPLANQTVALFDDAGRPYAVVYSDNYGRLVYPLPSLGAKSVVRVSWYLGYLRQLLENKPEYTIWIYDQTISRDVTELGYAVNSSKIRTYVYPVTAVVKRQDGTPLIGAEVIIKDKSTKGQLFSATLTTGSDGSAQLYFDKVSKYSSGRLSQVPPTDFEFNVTYTLPYGRIPVATGNFSIIRGASVPATGWNVEIITVLQQSVFPVKYTTTRGNITIYNVPVYVDGRIEKRNINVTFYVRKVDAETGEMVFEAPIPTTYPYDYSLYITQVTVGDVEIKLPRPVEIARGKLTDLRAGLDFMALGATAKVKIAAIDQTNTPRNDWRIQLIVNNQVAKEGAGVLDMILPRTDKFGLNYTVRIITNIMTPDGKPLVINRTMTLTQSTFTLQIPIFTVKVVVQVVDGFGNVRSDWPVVIENVATGMGQVSTELVEGQQYVVRGTGLGFTNTTMFIAKGPQMVVRVKIPTGKLVAQVKDGFGKVRNDWGVEVVGVASGQGTVGPVEVLAGQYTVRTTALGKTFEDTVQVVAGQTVSKVIQVPTAVLSVTAVDDDKKPIDRYVTSVTVGNLVFSTPPKELELLAGTYTVTVSALGKDASAQVTLNAGEVRNLQIVVPGTAGLDFLGTRIPLPTLVLYALLLLVVIVILAILIIEYNNWRRRRLMQILAPPK